MINISAILLAAGASTRMGSVKALLPVRGKPAVCHLAGEFLRVCSRCIVVTGYHHQRVEEALAADACADVEVVRNPEPERGQLSSLQCGIRVLSEDPEGWFLYAPVDCLGIDFQVLSAIQEALLDAPREVVLCIPRHEDRRGHPVAVMNSRAKEFLALPATDSARAVIHRLRAQTRFVDIQQGGFLQDVDNPKDYERFLAGCQREGADA